MGDRDEAAQHINPAKLYGSASGLTFATGPKRTCRGGVRFRVNCGQDLLAGHKNIQHAVRYTELHPRPVPELLEGLVIKAAARFVAIVIGTLLAACSGSNRVENIVPTWANTSPRSAMAPAPQRDARKSSEGRSQEAKEPTPQEAKRPASPPEEE